MAKDTKERILEAALEIFTRDGYAGTNIKDIAESVGIVKSALYRHFESKEAIWDAVIERMITYYEEHVGSKDGPSFVPQSTEELFELTVKMVNFTVHDKKIVQIRKLFTVEQFRDEKARECANNYFLYKTEEMFTKIFLAMMGSGSIKKCDPRMLAFSYTAPITVLIHLCDREPSKEPEAMDKMEKFIRSFIDEYKQV